MFILNNSKNNKDFFTSPVITIVDEIIQAAIKSAASDIHIQPLESSVGVRFRINGVLIEFKKLELVRIEEISIRIKVMAGLDISEKRLPQDGRINYFYKEKKYSLRISCFPCIKGEKIVVRILSSDLILDRTSLGFSISQQKIINNLLNPNSGLVLVTGSTGSGKTTTLYSIISSLNNQKKNIITVEDPVEKIFDGVTQIEINEKKGLNFSNVLRSIVRQDPDVLMIGEIRDTITARLALQASVTGHLVLSSLHTNDTFSTIARLINMGIERYLLIEGISGIISQRLVKKRCKEYNFKTKCCTNRKCSKQCICENGYVGRTVKAEILVFDENIRNYIMENKSSEFIKNYCSEKGMKLIDS